MRNKAVFIDKDGTLIEDVPYNVDINKIKLLSGSIEGLTILQDAGYKLILISNQSGIARGYFSEEDLIKAFQYIENVLINKNIHLNGYYFCPHHKTGIRPEYTYSCECRKPLPGMLIKAAQDHTIDLLNSWMIGDVLHDVEAGKRAGTKTIFIDNGHEIEWKINEMRIPSALAHNLKEAAEIIISESNINNIERLKP